MSYTPLQTSLPSGLYIAATPIGNLRDVTLRVLDVLASADIILCEDTRMSKKLFRHYNIYVKKLERYDDYSTEKDRQRILQYLKTEQSVVLISDAGSPLISDPGYKLVKEVREHNYSISVLPGACSAIAALQMSGIASDKFFFEGFLPRKKEAIIKRLHFFKQIQTTIIVYESARRLSAILPIINDILPLCKMAVLREMTKIYEECISNNVAEILDYIKIKPPKGEIVLVIDTRPSVILAPTETVLRNLVEDNNLLEQSAKQAAKFLANHTGLSIQNMYNYIVTLKNNPLK